MPSCFKIGRHKGLKILAACGVPVRVWPRAPVNIFQMKEELNRALDLHKKGFINQAEKIYLDLIKINNKNPGLFQLLGTLYLQKKVINCQRSILIKV